MKVNIGSIDRVIRIAVGLALILLGFSGVIGPWGLVGLLPLATGIFKFCPAYSLFNINTCKMKKS